MVSHLPLVSMAGFEPAPYRFVVYCSIQMSYIEHWRNRPSPIQRPDPGIRGWQRRPHRQSDHLWPLGSDPSDRDVLNRGKGWIRSTLEIRPVFKLWRARNKITKLRNK